MSKHSRVVSLDFLRVIAIILVVLIHSAEASLHSDVDVIPLIIINVVGRLGVPIFLMLSGFLLLRKDYSSSASLKSFYTHNLFYLLVSFELWNSLTFFVKRCFLGYSLSYSQWIYSSLIVGKEIDAPLWYMRMIIPVYCIIPFLSRSLKKMNKICSNKVLIVLYLFAFVSFSVLPTLDRFVYLIGDIYLFNQGIMQLCVYCSYVMYLVTGFMVRNVVNASGKVALLLICLGMIGNLFFYGLDVYTGKLGETMGYFSCFSFFVVTGLFVLFLRFDALLDKISFKKKVQSVAVMSYGIYVSHHLIILIISKFVSFDSGLLRLLYIFLLTFIISYVIVYYLSRCSSLRKWLLHAC